MSTQLRFARLILLFSLSLSSGMMNAQKDALSPPALRDLRHQEPQWLTVQGHLPDLATATPERLEMAGDVLRARRYPEDALEYYVYALQRGGQETKLLNKLGITELELRHAVAARAYFQKVVQLQRKNPDGWNNLGAVDYLDRRFGASIADYKRAIKLDKNSATFHSNLGTAYFEQKDYSSARKQFRIALQLDPDVGSHDGAGGIRAHMLSPDDRARYCFEMARLYAESGEEENMLRFLTMASEGGFDVVSEMGGDSVLTRYRKDPRVALLVRNAKALRDGRTAIAEVKGGLPPLPPETRE